MSSNNGWLGLNKPSFLKSISGIFLSSFGFPLSSSSRNINKVLNGAPPQYLASYLVKYQPQLGSRKRGYCIMVPSMLEQISKATWRRASGVPSILATLGSPLGTGSGPVGSAMSRGGPSTITVASVTGYDRIVGGVALQGSGGGAALPAGMWSRWEGGGNPTSEPHGPGKSALWRVNRGAGATPEGDTDALVAGSRVCNSYVPGLPALTSTSM